LKYELTPPFNADWHRLSPEERGLFRRAVDEFNQAYAQRGAEQCGAVCSVAMRTGKLPPELLGALLAKIPRRDTRVLLGSGIGEDAAVLDFARAPDGGDAGGDRLLVAKTDPITFATDLIGWYAVHVNANDVACSGAIPRWFMATALLPERWEAPEIERLFDQVIDACDSLGVSLVGGHTEVTAGLAQPIVVGCMLGEVERSRVVRTGGGRPGDAIILTQGIAVEGTAVLAREAADEIQRRGVPRAIVERAQGLLFAPGIGVVKAARTLCDRLPLGSIHGLHDPTEGGLSAGLWELAAAARLGARIDAGAIHVLPETRQVCDALQLDPLGLLASGALLAAVAPAAAGAALEALAGAGIPAHVIGALTPPDEGIRLAGAGGATQPWPQFDRDEVARYFAGVA
jgi:hydrogenase maturation factor